MGGEGETEMLSMDGVTWLFAKRRELGEEDENERPSKVFRLAFPLASRSRKQTLSLHGSLGKFSLPGKILERVKGFEPSTSTLATWRSSQLS